MTVYATFDAAARRVEALKKLGHWPGITCHRDGSYSLTWDPGYTATRY